jgi:hypothetical protein
MRHSNGTSHPRAIHEPATQMAAVLNLEWGVCRGGVGGVCRGLLGVVSILTTTASRFSHAKAPTTRPANALPLFVARPQRPPPSRCEGSRLSPPRVFRRFGPIVRSKTTGLERRERNALKLELRESLACGHTGHGASGRRKLKRKGSSIRSPNCHLVLLGNRPDQGRTVLNRPCSEGCKRRLAASVRGYAPAIPKSRRYRCRMIPVPDRTGMTLEASSHQSRHRYHQLLIDDEYAPFAQRRFGCIASSFLSWICVNARWSNRWRRPWSHRRTPGRPTSHRLRSVPEVQTGVHGEPLSTLAVVGGSIAIP